MYLVTQYSCHSVIYCSACLSVRPSVRPSVHFSNLSISSNHTQNSSVVCNFHSSLLICLGAMRGNKSRLFFCTSCIITWFSSIVESSVIILTLSWLFITRETKACQELQANLVRKALQVVQDHVVYLDLQARVTNTWKALVTQMKLTLVISTDHVIPVIQDRKYAVIISFLRQ